MNASLRKMENEKNEFIRKLSKEQFDGVLTSKYRKVFMDYFDGMLSDSDLAKKIDSNMELISIYTNGDSDKIDANQYLYSAIVDVALNYYNVANGFETCLNKLNLCASYFQLISIANEKLMHLKSLIYDAFFINAHFDDDNGVELLHQKLIETKDLAKNLDDLLVEISKHEDVIDEVEKTSGTAFLNESLIDENIKEMYVNQSKLASKIKDEFYALLVDCSNESDDEKLDIMKGKFV